MILINIINSPKGGGAELVVNELHKSFLEKKIRSYLVFFSKNNHQPTKNEIFFGLDYRNPFNIIKLREFILSIKRKNCEKLIVHAHLTLPFYYTVIATLGIKDINLIYTEHSIKFRKILFLNYFENLFYKRYQKIICISDGVKNSLLDWLGNNYLNRLITIWNGSRTYSYKKRVSLNLRFPRLISVGSLVGYKNFKTTIIAVSNIRNKIQSYVILGNGPDYNSLNSLIKKANMQNKIMLKGWKNDIEKDLQDSDILLIPSKFEGFGLVAVEGLSTGLSVVASNVDGLNEVLVNDHRSTTLVNDYNSIKSWEEAINEAIQKIKLYGEEEISRLSLKQSRRFTFKKMSENYLDLYSKI